MEQNYIHKNCVHYKDGLCTLNQISVDPNGSACPRFIPKKLADISNKEAPSQNITQNNQQPFLNMGYGETHKRGSAGSGMGKKRRKRHGLRSRARNSND
jgi:hypothetical protein